MPVTCIPTILVLLVSGLIIAVVSEMVNEKCSAGGDENVQFFEQAAVAADTELCSPIGKSILLKGGNAVDASIATLLCSGLTCPQSMGIGGGFFMVLYNRTTGRATTIDARETAPGAATQNMFVNNHKAASVGGLSVAVPGEVKGYWTVHQKYGSLPWRELFLPTIRLARNGFPVPESLADALRRKEEYIRADPELRKTYTNPETGELYTAGEVMRQVKLADTLTVISLEGEGAFYQGALTDAIMEDLKDIGSIITSEDLGRYRVLEKPPIETSLTSGIRVFGVPAPSSGPVLAFLLNIIDGYKLTPMDISSAEASSLTYHRFVEALKFAYAFRSRLGDEDFEDMSEVLTNLTSRQFAEELRSRLITDNGTHDLSYYGGIYSDRLTTGTSQLSVIDQHGNAVSVTSTINLTFGCKRLGKRTGILFNNGMDDFSSPNITSMWGVPPSPVNYIKPGKRPLSSMCPTVLVDPNDDVIGVYGGAGGTKITSTTAWVMMHHLWLGDSLETAVERTRIHNQLIPPTIFVENFALPQDVMDKLKAKGHELDSFKRGESICQAISVDKKSSTSSPITACSDSRKGGVPEGF